MKILFYGSSSYCLPILESLRKSFQIVGVITKPSGTTRDFAVKFSFPYFTPATKTELISIKDKLSALKPDIAVVADFGLIIPKDIFGIPKFKTLNIHFSKLPKLRGASPVQSTILNGQSSAWITVIIMDKGLDTGDIIWQKEVKIKGDETAEMLYKNLFEIAAQNISDIINQFVKGNIKPVKQDNTKATYTKILTRGDGFISLKDFKLSFSDASLSRQIERKLRAFTPYPGLWTTIKIGNMLKRLKVLKIHTENNKLILDQVQLEGKKPVSWKQLKEGYPEIKIT